jgi:hypothetical protein
MIPIANVIAADLGPTEGTYTRREMRAIVGGQWPDGRDATVILDMQSARNRYRGGRHCKSVVSGYAVSRVQQVGFMGEVLVWDKLFPVDEHGEEDERKDVPQPPYTVRIDQHGEPYCTCMAGNCKAPSCRHVDASLYLLDAGVFNEQPQGI